MYKLDPMASAPHRPIVGVAVFVFNGKGEFLLGKRRGGHGEGTWGLPGGHLEYKESFAACAEREIVEETNLLIKDIEFFTATNDFHKPEQRHGVTIFMLARMKDNNQRAELLEPEKCEGWRWHKWDLVEDSHATTIEGQHPLWPCFLPLYSLIEQCPGARERLQEMCK